jgi:hypothetical protein
MPRQPVSAAACVFRRRKSAFRDQRDYFAEIGTTFNASGYRPSNIVSFLCLGHGERQLSLQAQAKETDRAKLGTNYRGGSESAAAR